IKCSFSACFGSGKAPAVGCPAKIHTKSMFMGVGLTDKDQQVGITTINEKLESMCPHYHAMNKLMGDQEFLNTLQEMVLEAVTWKATMIMYDEDGDKLGASVQKVERNLADETNKPNSPPQSVHWMNFFKMNHMKRMSNHSKRMINHLIRMINHLKRMINHLKGMINHLKRMINHMKRRFTKKLRKENKGHQTLRTSTLRAKAPQKKLQIHLNPMRSIHPREIQVSTLASRIGKAQVARDGLSFVMLKYECQFKNNDKGVELEEKNFNHTVALGENKWFHGIKLEEKK
ncbi:hypothetical protein VP01_4017g2, partial [Puccinia sorghi]